MKFHKISNIFPLMSEEEYRALVQDIKGNGQREPIWTFNREIIDGRNRYNACEELGLEPKYREWKGKEGNGSLVSFIVSLNLHRRHLTSSQKAVVGLEIEKLLSEDAKERQRQAGKVRHKLVEKIPQAENGKARDKAANIAGTNPRYISDAKKINTKAPELIEDVREGRLTIKDAKHLTTLESEDRERIVKVIREGKAKNLKSAKSIVRQKLKSSTTYIKLTSNQFNLIHSPIESLNEHIKDNSIDVIITDPPYSKEYLDLYEELAKLSSRILKEGRSLLVMAGQSYLPEIFQLMVPYINYNWTLDYQTPGGKSAQIWQRKVNTFWKPVLWFVKGKYKGDWIGDVCRSNVNSNEKSLHNWQQSESGMEDIVEKITKPKDLILDPFCGSGTTGIAAIRLGRKFIGSDKDKECINTSAKRLQEEVENVKRSKTGKN